MRFSVVVLSFLSLVLTLGLASSTAAAELPGPITLEQQLTTGAAEQDATPADAEPISIEELNALFGAEKVCGVLCGNDIPRRNCTFLCGGQEPAQCLFGRCVWS